MKNHDMSHKIHYVPDCMQVLFNKYFIQNYDGLICHFHITSYMKELRVLWRTFHMD